MSDREIEKNKSTFKKVKLINKKNKRGHHQFQIMHLIII